MKFKAEDAYQAQLNRVEMTPDGLYDILIRMGLPQEKAEKLQAQYILDLMKAGRDLSKM